MKQSRQARITREISWPVGPDATFPVPGEQAPQQPDPPQPPDSVREIR